MQKTNAKDMQIIELAVQKGVDYLYARQRSDDSWPDTLPSSAIATGMIMVALHLSGQKRFSALLLQGAVWLRSTQRPDGSWGDAVVDPGNLNGTTIAIAALQLTDSEQSREAIERGRAFIEASGCMAAVCDRGTCSISDFCLLLLALAGFYEWQQLKRLPLTLVLLPGWLKEQVSFTMPCVLAWALAHAHLLQTPPFRRILNRFALPQALRWINDAQASDGGFQESPFVAGVVYIGLKLANIENTTTERCLSYMLATRRSDGSWPINRDLEFCATTYVLLGLEAVNALDRLSYQPVIDWLLARQQQSPFSPTGCPAGGWGWSLPSGWPNSDDTGRALMVLHLLGIPADDRHIQAGAHWLEKMQNKDGSWACFVRQGILTLDQPCPGLTAYAVMGLAQGANYSPSAAPIARALRYFEYAQGPDGSFQSLWFRGLVAGTAFVLDAYATLGLCGEPVPRRCQGWLLSHQNSDGSWGKSQEHPDTGTVEETAWALAALARCGTLVAPDALDRGAQWLAEAQLPDGSWEPNVIGVYFNSMYFSSDHMADGYILQALGRYLSANKGRDKPSPYGVHRDQQGTGDGIHRGQKGTGV